MVFICNPHASILIIIIIIIIIIIAYLFLLHFFSPLAFSSISLSQIFSVWNSTLTNRSSFSVEIRVHWMEKGAEIAARERFF